MRSPIRTFLAASLLAPLAAGQDLPIAPDQFNLFSALSVGYQWGSDVQGVVACGGDFLADGFSLHAVPGAGPGTGVSLYAGGTVTFGASGAGAQINNGGIEAGGDIYLQYTGTFGALSGGGNCALVAGQIQGDVTIAGTFTGNTLDVGGSITESVPFTPSIDFSGYEDYYLRLADAYAGLPHDVNWIDDYGNIRMQLGPGLNVARVSLSTIARSHSFTVDGPPGAILVINAMGNSAEFSSLTWNLSGGVERRDIAINAFEALKGTLAGGNHVTLLAPRAQLTFLQGLLTGNLIVRGLRGVGQLNDGPWRGFYYSPNDGSPGTDVCGSTPNSTTLPAIMACTGSNSFTANDVTLRAIQLPPGEFSIFYYGRAPAYAPLGLGYRCIGGGGYTRLPVLLSGGGGVLTYPLDLHNLPPGPHAAISIGETIYFQAWYRDPQDIYPHNNLSNAIKISFGP